MILNDLDRQTTDTALVANINKAVQFMATASNNQ